jgi:hypothetical protein
MGKRRPLLIIASSLAALPARGCGESAPGGGVSLGFSEPFDCGTSTCASGQICLTTESSPFTPPADPTFECVAPPSGCDAATLCDCAYPDPYQGRAVTGCSVLAERTLYLTDVSCGGGPCAADQVCVLEGSGGSPVTAATPAACVNLPDGCTRSMDFCSTPCADAVATASGGSRTGCMGADWALAIWIDPA